MKPSLKKKMQEGMLPFPFQKSVNKVSILLIATALIKGVMARYSPDVGSVSVTDWQKISNVNGNLGHILMDDANGYPDLFGHSVAPLGDLNGDGVPDVAVGTFGGNHGPGKIYVLFLNADGTVSSKSKISDTSGGKGWKNNVQLCPESFFGAKLGSAGDIDGDGINELIVGNYGDDEAGDDSGAAWILFLNKCGKVRKWQKITKGQGNFNGQLSPHDQFGSAVSTVGDIDGDGIPDLAIGAWHDDDEGSDAGALWILFMNSDGTVRSQQKIPSSEAGFSGKLENNSLFGMSVARIGDIAGNGNTSIAVGQKDAVWILSLDSEGKVVWSNKDSISNAFGSDYFNWAHRSSDGFGWDVSEAGDIDYDGIPDLLVSRRPSSGENGEVWLLLLNADGTVKEPYYEYHVITDGTGNFPYGTIPLDTSFGSSVALLGDVNGDGYPDLAVGAIGDSNKSGAAWIIDLIPPAKQLYSCMFDWFPLCITLRASEDEDNSPLYNFNKLELDACEEQPQENDLFNRQLWIFDGSSGKAQNIKAAMDYNLETCVETYSPSEARLRINPCNKTNKNTYNEFIFERKGYGDVEYGYQYKICNANDTSYCVTNVGPVGGEYWHGEADSRYWYDPMKLMKSFEEDRDDFLWRAAIINDQQNWCG